MSLVFTGASAIPLACDSQELFGVENQTYWFEHDAVQWFSEHGVESYASDQRLSETGARLFDLNSSSFYVLETDWNSTGAQEFPFGVVIVSNETISQKLNESSVVYIGGPVGGQLTLFWTMP